MSKINDKKLREYWINAGFGFKVAEVQILTAIDSDPGVENKKLVHVREVVPGSVNITREEFWTAVERISFAYHVATIRDLEIELFGEK